MLAPFIKVSVFVGSRFGATLLQFLITLSIARVFGAETLGSFQTFLSFTFLFGSLFSLGFPTFVAREVSIQPDVDGGEKTASIIKWVFAATGVFCLASFLLWNFLIKDFVTEKAAFDSAIYSLALIAGGLYGGQLILSETLKGLKQVGLSLVVEFYLPIILFMVFMLRGYYNEGLTQTNQILQLYLYALLISFIVSAAFVFSRFRVRIHAGKLSNDFSELMRLWGIRLINALYPSAPYILLPLVSSAAEIGFFSIAHKLVSIIATVVTAIASMYLARFSSSFHAGSMAQLSSLYRESRRILVLITTPIAIAYILFPGNILPYFGQEFISATGLLIALGLTRYLSNYFGLTELLLNMSGYAAQELKSAIISLSFFFLASGLVIGLGWGVMGITLVFGLTFIIRSAVSYFFVNRLVFKSSL